MIADKGGGPTTIAGGHGPGTGAGIGGNVQIAEPEEENDPAKTAFGTWTCPQCGNRNPESATTCQACDSPREFSKAEYDAMIAKARELEELGQQLEQGAEDAKAEGDTKSEKQFRKEAEENFTRAAEINQRSLAAHNHIKG
jgi:ribosomal protein L40E